MKHIKIIVLSLLFAAVTGCSGVPKNPPASPTTVTIEKPQPNAEMVKLSPKEVIPTSTNSCIDDMTLLKQTRYHGYQTLIHQYGELMNEYGFLRKNSEIMDNDTKRYLSDMLTMKRETLCSRIKFTAFQSIKAKMASLMNI